MDEFRTSCRCSSCEGKCKTFRECDNPRPWKNNRIIRHGLIKCKTCLGLWNRDTNASMNILHIVKNDIMRKEKPEYLRRTKSSISGTISVSDYQSLCLKIHRQSKNLHRLLSLTLK